MSITCCSTGAATVVPPFSSVLDVIPSMKQRFEAWREPNDGALTFASTESLQAQRAKGLISEASEFLYAIEADTWEEACAIHYLRMGFGPYKPEGEPKPCPKCGSCFYPEGSGQFWHCGPIW